ncbi:Permease of the drug/metabolite transporter (DMT) superfamily [Pseudonocardia oroxyli]|uniref:Permease of the drug/metabolite transporter (DMT) superfamily n=1 Tax=Pseudonocardia oroxyli TaxID=366584 RepID=A0A1G7K1B9_PSEOR|nr:Permease of the drug/metabolite transporter (DMT) superfamily [Pseudonocardia oroxyli]
MPILFVLFWSSGFVGAELGTGYAPVDTLLAWRYLIAAALLWGAVLVVRRPIPRGAVRRQALLGTLGQALYLGGVVTGVALGVPAGTAALVAALQPLVVAVAGPLVGEHTTLRQRIGLGAGLVGVTLVVAGDLGPGTAPWWAFLLPFGGTLALSAGTLLERRWNPPETPLVAMALQVTAAAALFWPVTGLLGQAAPPADPGFWGALAWVVLLSTFGGYGTYLLVLRRHSATRVSVLLYLTPPVTMVGAYLMFGEAPGVWAVPGVALAAVGVWLVLGRRETVGGRRHSGRGERTGRFLPRHPGLVPGRLRRAHGRPGGRVECRAGGAQRAGRGADRVG